MQRVGRSITVPRLLLLRSTRPGAVHLKPCNSALCFFLNSSFLPLFLSVVDHYTASFIHQPLRIHGLLLAKYLLLHKTSSYVHLKTTSRLSPDCHEIENIEGSINHVRRLCSINRVTVRPIDRRRRILKNIFHHR